MVIPPRKGAVLKVKEDNYDQSEDAEKSDSSETEEEIPENKLEEADRELATHKTDTEVLSESPEPDTILSVEDHQPDRLDPDTTDKNLNISRSSHKLTENDSDLAAR